MPIIFRRVAKANCITHAPRVTTVHQEPSNTPRAPRLQHGTPGPANGVRRPAAAASNHRRQASTSIVAPGFSSPQLLALAGTWRLRVPWRPRLAPPVTLTAANNQHVRSPLLRGHSRSCGFDTRHCGGVPDAGPPPPNASIPLTHICSARRCVGAMPAFLPSRLFVLNPACATAYTDHFWGND